MKKLILYSLIASFILPSTTPLNAGNFRQFCQENSTSLTIGASVVALGTTLGLLYWHKQKKAKAKTNSTRSRPATQSFHSRVSGATLTADSSSSYVTVNGQKIELYPFSRTENFEKPIGSKGKLDITKFHGRVTAEGWDGDTIQVQAKIKAHTQEDLDQLKVALEITGKNGVLSNYHPKKDFTYRFGANAYQQAAPVRRNWFSSFFSSFVSVSSDQTIMSIPPHIEYTIKMPKTTFIKSECSGDAIIKKCNGADVVSLTSSVSVENSQDNVKAKGRESINLSDIKGKAEAISDHDTITMTKIHGDATAHARETIWLTNIHGPAQATSDHDKVIMKNIDGHAIARAQESINIEGCDAADATSEHSSVSINDCRGRAIAKGRQGISLTNIKGKAEATSDHDTVTMKNVHNSATAQAREAIWLTDVHGSAEATSDHEKVIMKNIDGDAIAHARESIEIESCKAADAQSDHSWVNIKKVIGHAKGIGREGVSISDAQSVYARSHHDQVQLYKIRGSHDAHGREGTWIDGVRQKSSRR